MTLTLDLHLAHNVSSAVFSEDRRYRYELTRRWGPGPALMFVSLNPSDADEHRDDPTTRRDVRFARGFGYDAVTLLNLNAGRTPNPAELADMDDPVGPDNDAHLDRAAAEHDVIVFAWGADARSGSGHRGGYPIVEHRSGSRGKRRGAGLDSRRAAPPPAVSAR